MERIYKEVIERWEWELRGGWDVSLSKRDNKYNNSLVGGVLSKSRNQMESRFASSNHCSY